ncbi:MAG: PEP-CTERM sorting domain-containing protein [Vicinamibacteraceae bacterium]|nr:PEP-CTERM sorting domain-containing protein [Vicinamibacteraceae bacterium]
MKVITKALATATMAAAIFALGTAQADAAYALRLSDGTTTISIDDNDANDANATVGAITYIGNLSGATINVTTGIGQPPLPGTPPNMDLSSVNVNTNGPVTITIDFTQTDWALTAPVSVKGNVGGTNNNNTADFYAYYDDANGFFGGTQFLSLGPFGNGAYSGTTSGTIAGVTSPYSISMRAILAFASAGSASFDYELIPEPASLLLVGVGLLGLGALRRRRA